MKAKINKNKKIILFTISLLVFFLILIDVFRTDVTRYDNWAYSIFVENLRNDSMTTIMKIITEFGNVFIMLFIIILLFFKDKKQSLYASVNMCLIFIINSIVKVIVQRPRPSGYNLINESNFSFPSGHSMVSTAFYGFLIYFIYKNVKNKKTKYTLISLLFILIMLICISRIYLGVHYLSDTLAGFFLSISYLMVFISVIPILEKNIKTKSNKE